MKYILGIDAAWTAHHPSGLALIQADDEALSLIAVARSYEEFLKGKPCPIKALSGTMPDFSTILEKCCGLGMDVDLLALDIPLSPEPIISRRESDSQISIMYGSRGASTHTPNPSRPGAISMSIYQQLVGLGYKWNGVPPLKSFIEVYPHTAIIELFKYEYRLPYKVQNRAKYWKKTTPDNQKMNITAMLNELREKIISRIPNASDIIKEATPNMDNTELKGFEDCLDAIICALTGFEYIYYRVEKYGDEKSCIWVPRV
jgi:hypothetical protein